MSDKNSKNRKLLEKTKKEIEELIKEAGGILNSLIQTVSETLFKADSLTEIIVKSKSEELRSTILTVIEVGGGLEVVSRYIMARVITETAGQTNDQADLFEIISKTARNIVKASAEASGDLEAAARGAVRGAIEGARVAGRDVQEAASAAASGVVEEAYLFSFDAGTRVRETVMGTISDVEEARGGWQ